MAITITYYESADFFNSTADVTGVAWSAGDFVVVCSGNEDAETALGNPTNANLSFTLRLDPATQFEESRAKMSTAPATSTETGQTISVSSSVHAGTSVWVLSPGAGETFAWGSGEGKDTGDQTAATLTPTAGDVVIAFLSDWSASNPPNLTAETNTGTLTERTDQGNGSTWAAWAVDWNGVDAGSDDWGATLYSGVEASQVVGVIAVTASVTIEQEGFRFRTDSGNEATATWEAAQDTNVTMPAEVTKGLRVLLDFDGDPDSAAPKLQYRRVGSTDWRDV